MISVALPGELKLVQELNTTSVKELLQLIALVGVANSARGALNSDPWPDGSLLAALVGGCQAEAGMVLVPSSGGGPSDSSAYTLAAPSTVKKDLKTS